VYAFQYFRTNPIYQSISSLGAQWAKHPLIALGIVAVHRCHMRQHLTPVYPTPIEAAIREDIDVVPAQLRRHQYQSSLERRTHLLGEEVFQSRQPKDLWQLTRITKGIWQPCLSAVLAKSRLEVSLTV